MKWMNGVENKRGEKGSAGRSAAARVKQCIALVLAVMLIFSTSTVLSIYADTTVDNQITSTTDAPGAVKGIQVERDDLETAQTIDFDGGEITEATAPVLDDNATFGGAYVEIGGNRYPLSWLGTLDGDICYTVATSEENADADKQENDAAVQSAERMDIGIRSVLAATDKLIFTYTSIDSSKMNTITYSVGTLAQTDLTDLGGGTSLVRKQDKIVDGQAGYFQVKRVPGTTLTIKATNGDGTQAKVENISASPNKGFIETYKLSGTSGNVLVEITPTWTDSSYNVSLNVKSVGVSGVTSKDGRVRIMTRVAQDGNSIGTDAPDKPYAQVFASQSDVPQITDTQKVAMWNELGRNTVSWYYITNSVGFKQNLNNNGWRQRLSAIRVNDETVAIPDGTVQDKAGKAAGSYVETVLQNGEAKGTRIKVWCYDTESSDAGQGIYNDIQRYGITVSNVHADVSIEMVYSPVGTQGVMWMNYAAGVDQELYLVPDWTNGVTGWQTMYVGSYYYQKNSKDSSNNAVPYQVRWKEKQGYYNSKLTVNYNGKTSTYTGSSIGTGSDGYYTTDIGVSLSNASLPAVLSLEAEPISYNVTYNANQGSYRATPTDTTTYNSATYSQILIDQTRPTREGYVFTGYKIAGEKKGTLLQPGELINLTNTDSLDLSGISVSSDGKATIALIAQWKAIDSNDVMTDVNVTIKKQVRAGDTGWEEEEKTFSVAVGSTYKVASYPQETTDSYGTWKLSGSENLTGVAGSSADGSILYYRHPSTVTYTEGAETLDDASTLPASLTNIFAFDAVTLSSTQLTKTGTSVVTRLATEEEQGAEPEDAKKEAAEEQGTKPENAPEDQSLTADEVQDEASEEQNPAAEDVPEETAAGQLKSFSTDNDRDDENTYTVTTGTAYEHIGWTDQDGNHYNLGATANVPWGGLTLTPRWRITVTTTNAQIQADDFTLTQKQAKEICDGSVTGADLQTLLIGYAEAKAFSWDADPTNKTPLEISGVSHTIEAPAEGGTYTCTFTAGDAEETVEVTVLPARTRVNRLSASDFALTLTEAISWSALPNSPKSLWGINQESKLIKWANAQAWVEGDETTKPEILKNEITSTIQAVPGIYTVTFKSAAIDGDDNDTADSVLEGQSKTVVVIVLRENIEASDFTVTAAQAANLDSSELIRLAGATAWNGSDRNSKVALSATTTATAEPGVYEATFVTEAGTKKTVNVTVTAPTSPYVPTPTVPTVPNVEDPDEPKASQDHDLIADGIFETIVDENTASEATARTATTKKNTESKWDAAAEDDDATTADLPQTGDRESLLLWIAAFAAAGILALYVRKQDKTKSGNRE